MIVMWGRLRRVRWRKSRKPRVWGERIDDLTVEAGMFVAGYELHWGSVSGVVEEMQLTPPSRGHLKESEDI